MRNLVLTDGTISASVCTDGGDRPVTTISIKGYFKSQAELSTITNKTCNLLLLQGLQSAS